MYSILTLLAVLLAPTLANIFVGYDRGLYELTRKAFTVYSVSFLFAGFNIYASSFFTALGNGLVSAIISFLRTCVFQVAAIFAMPAILGNDGIWLAIVAAELMSIGVSIFFIVKNKKKYGY